MASARCVARFVLGGLRAAARVVGAQRGSERGGTRTAAASKHLLRCGQSADIRITMVNRPSTKPRFGDTEIVRLLIAAGRVTKLEDKGLKLRCHRASRRKTY